MILDEQKSKVRTESSCMSQWKLQYLVHHYQPSSGLELDVTTVLFFSRIQFKIHTTLISFSGPWQFLSPSLFFMILTVLKSTSEVFCKIEIAIFYMGPARSRRLLFFNGSLSTVTFSSKRFGLKRKVSVITSASNHIKN